MPPTASRRRPARLAVGVLAAALSALAALPSAGLARAATPRTGSPSSAPAARQLLTALNAERSGHQLAPLAVAGDLTAVAVDWAGRMAKAHQVAQNPSLPDEAGDWLALGENVGMGPDAARVESAFLTSPTHRANMLDPRFSQIGVGTAVGSDGTLFVVEDFRQPAGAPSPSASPAPPAPTASPRAPVPTPTSSSAPGAPSDAPQTAGSRNATGSSPLSSLREQVVALARSAPVKGDPLTRATGFVAALARLAALPARPYRG